MPQYTVYFEAENIESTRSDTTYLLKTFASIAQAKIEEISYNVKWGYEKRTLEGKADIRDMYGYDKAEVDGETIIKINEEEAQIVREIFAMYLNGYSSYKIAGELSRRNIKTKQGKKLWRSSTIAGIFTNVALIKT
jgi:site-specific DNA recombinase